MDPQAPKSNSLGSSLACCGKPRGCTARQIGETMKEAFRHNILVPDAGAGPTPGKERRRPVGRSSRSAPRNDLPRFQRTGPSSQIVARPQMLFQDPCNLSDPRDPVNILRRLAPRGIPSVQSWAGALTEPFPRACDLLWAGSCFSLDRENSYMYIYAVFYLGTAHGKAGCFGQGKYHSHVFSGGRDHQGQDRVSPV